MNSVVMLATQIKRTKRDAMEADYYDVYVQRKEVLQREKQKIKQNIMNMKGVKDAYIMDKIPEHEV